MFAIDQTKPDQRRKKPRKGNFSRALTGLRFYIPRLGRWASRDPVGERAGANVQQFVLNCPTGMIDIVGLANAAQTRFAALSCAMRALVDLYGSFRRGHVPIQNSTSTVGVLQAFTDNLTLNDHWAWFVGAFVDYQAHYDTVERWHIIPGNFGYDGLNPVLTDPTIRSGLFYNDPRTAIQTLLHEPQHNIYRYGRDEPHNSPGFRWDQAIGDIINDAKMIASNYRVPESCCIVNPNRGLLITSKLGEISCRCGIPFGQW